MRWLFVFVVMEDPFRIYLPNSTRRQVADPLQNRLRTRGRMFRIGSPRNSSSVAIMPRAHQLVSTIRVSSEQNLQTALPNIIRVEAEHSATKTSVSTQTGTLNFDCDSNHKKTCEYINNVADQAPSDFLCPITQQAMRQPVVASDGFTYEWSAITKWLSLSYESPCTRETLGKCSVLNPLYPNRALKCLMEEWVQEHTRRQQINSMNAMLLRV